MNGLVVVLVIVTVVVKSMNDSTFYEKDSSMLTYVQFFGENRSSRTKV